MQDTVTHDEGLEWGGRKFGQRQKKRQAGCKSNSAEKLRL